MIFEELHTYLETTMPELSHDVFIVDKRSLSDELMKREERFALLSFFENLIDNRHISPGPPPGPVRLSGQKIFHKKNFRPFSGLDGALSYQTVHFRTIFKSV